MANVFASISNAAGILKNFYAGPIVTQFNDEIDIYRGCEKGKEKWNGLQVVRPVKVRRNQGVGAVSDGGTLPAIGKQTTQQALIPSKFNYLRAGMTGPMLKASQGDKGAFISIMAFEMEQGMNDLKSDINRQLSWDGTGDLALLNAAAVASTVVVVKGRESTEDGWKFIDIGTVIDVLDGTTGLPVASAVTINDLVRSGSLATLTLSAAVTVSANDVVIRSGSNGNEVQGLLTQLDGLTTTVFGIDRALYPAFQGNVVNAGGAQLTLDLLQQEEDLAMRLGGAVLDALYSDFVSRRYYQKLLTADKRFNNTIEGDGGFAKKGKSYLEWNGKPWVADKDCPTRIFMLESKHIMKYVLAELEWADETGSTMIRQTGADSYEIMLRFFFNLFNEKPVASAVLRNYISP